MFCINCFHEKTRVTNSRSHKKQPAVWRRRKCPNCQTIFSSYEQPALENTIVLGKNHSKHPFNIGKLTVSIARSFQHNKKSADYDSYFLAQTVQQRIIVELKHPSSDDIAAITHDVLNKFDPVAAIQYAAQHDLIIAKRRPGRPSTAYSPPGDQ